MTTNLLPTLTGQGRIFINVDGPGCSNPYKYYGCMKLDSVDKSFGDITPIYCPSNTTYDEFVEIGSVKGADSRATSTLTGILPINEESALEVLGRAGAGLIFKCIMAVAHVLINSLNLIQQLSLKMYD